MLELNEFVTKFKIHFGVNKKSASKHFSIYCKSASIILFLCVSFFVITTMQCKSAKSVVPHVYIAVIAFEARSSFIGIIRVEGFVSSICHTQLLMFTCLHVEISE